MGIFSRLFRRDAGAASGVESPRAGATERVFYDLKDPALADFLRGGTPTSAGASVSADSVLRVAAAYRCVTLLAESVAQLPLNLMRSPDGTSKEKATDHPLHEVLHSRPNRWQTAFEFIRMMEAHRLLRGNAYAYKVVSMGRTIELIPMHPDRVQVTQNPDLSLTYRYTPVNGGADRVFGQAEIFHLRDLSTNGYLGLSRVRLMREAVGLAMRTEEFGARVFRNGVKPGLVLKHANKLSQEAQARLKAQMDDRAGAEHAHSTMVLEEGMSVETLGFTADDMQFLETRSFQRNEIAMFFGVPPHLIGHTEKSTSWGTGIEQQNIGYLTFTLGPLLCSWEQAITRDCLSREEARTLYPHFVTAGLMRATAKDRGEFYGKALGSGGSPAWMTPNEVRALEDMNPIEGGDALPQPSQAAPRPAPPTGDPAP
jgi:HK97 family phage portal protein